MTIEIQNESGVELDELRVQRLARFVMDQMRVHPLAELSVTAVDEDTIAELNARWMDKQGPTDVLAFPMDEMRPGHVDEEPEEGILGDIAICPQVARRQADEARGRGQAGYDVVDELDLLTVHGILHLLGYDHAEPEEHAVMFGLQGDLLEQWRTTPESS